jgi:LysR family tcuABC transcriptional regulator
VAEINVTSLLALTVLGGLASTVLPWSAIAEHVDVGTVVVLPMTRPAVRRELALCTVDDPDLSPAVEVVAATVRQVCTSLIRDGRWRGARLRSSIGTHKKK